MVPLQGSLNLVLGFIAVLTEVPQPPVFSSAFPSNQEVEEEEGYYLEDHGT